jgi:hypothetical protein
VVFQTGLTISLRHASWAGEWMDFRIVRAGEAIDRGR